MARVQSLQLGKKIFSEEILFFFFLKNDQQFDKLNLSFSKLLIPENNAVIYDSVIFLENILMYYNINPDDAIIVFSGAMARHVLPFISVHPSYFKQGRQTANKGCICNREIYSKQPLILYKNETISYQSMQPI